MPAKRVIVHAVCGSCNAPVPLTGLVTSATCPACHRQTPIDPGAWRWVLGGEDRTVIANERILGETRTGEIRCPDCDEAMGDASLTAALAAASPAVACSSCDGYLPLRALPGGKARPAAWKSSLCSAVVGEDSKGALPTIECPACGGRVKVDGTARQATCPYCGASTPVPAELVHEVDENRIHSFYLWTSPVAARAAKRRALAGRLALGAVVVSAVAAAAYIFVPRFLPTHRPPAVGVACDDSTQKPVCAADNKKELECQHSKLVVAEKCGGHSGCSGKGDYLECDQTVAAVGDRCSGDGKACAHDKRSELECNDSRFVLASTCSGPRGCTATGGRVHCDDSFAAPGDACASRDYACSAFKPLMACKGPLHCRATADKVADSTTVHCDTSVADRGDSCSAGDWACSTDGKVVMSCQHGRFAFSKRCPGGCTSHDYHIKCR